jgi:molybdopterin-guanine dinucleotide biosynthesis protein A
MPLTGILLAGGRSVRMGRDKASLEFEGEPLAARVLRRLSEACEEVLVASGDGGRLGWLGVAQVADAIPDAGPLAGIVAGLEHASNEVVAVVAVDMPYASGPLLRSLAELRTDEDAVVPVTDRGPEPLHAVYAKAAAPAIRHRLEDGERAVHRALRSLRVREAGPEAWRRIDPTGRFPINVNRPEDVQSSGGGSSS